MRSCHYNLILSTPIVSSPVFSRITLDESGHTRRVIIEIILKSLYHGCYLGDWWWKIWHYISKYVLSKKWDRETLNLLCQEHWQPAMTVEVSRHHLLNRQDVECGTNLLSALVICDSNLISRVSVILRYICFLEPLLCQWCFWVRLHCQDFPVL